MLLVSYERASTFENLKADLFLLKTSMSAAFSKCIQTYTNYVYILNCHIPSGVVSELLCSELFASVFNFTLDFAFSPQKARLVLTLPSAAVATTKQFDRAGQEECFRNTGIS